MERLFQVILKTIVAKVQRYVRMYALAVNTLVIRVENQCNQLTACYTMVYVHMLHVDTHTCSKERVFTHPEYSGLTTANHLSLATTASL